MILVAATKAEEGDDSDREHAQARGARQAVTVGVFMGVVGGRRVAVGGVCMCRDRAGAWIVHLGCQHACVPCSVPALLVATPAAACVVPALGPASSLIAVCTA
jgi:putative Ca2+/H+ antiporter (TMEM165/GDT1 family)